MDTPGRRCGRNFVDGDMHGGDELGGDEDEAGMVRRRFEDENTVWSGSVDASNELAASWRRSGRGETRRRPRLASTSTATLVHRITASSARP
jgi:hypothetical protein